MGYQKSEMQKKINAIEAEFLSKEETPENIQWLYDQILEFVNSDNFAEEALMHGTAFEALCTSTIEEALMDLSDCGYAHYYPAEIDGTWRELFAEDQIKVLEETANKRLDEFIYAYIEEHKNDGKEY